MLPVAQVVPTNPALGVMIFVLGGLAGAVFYLPFKQVKGWAWESYWLIYALAGLLVIPWALALSTSPNVLAVLSHTPPQRLGYCFLCGAMWGVGGLTWGLMIRYLGVGLGLAIGCGLVSSVGTITPPILRGEINTLYGSPAANISLLGVLISIVGIILVGMAGMSKESELPEEAKKKAVADYNFKKGILIAIFSGVMSAGMNFGLQGAPVLQYKAEFGSMTEIGKDRGQLLAGAKVADEDVFFDKDHEVWVARAAASGEQLTSKSWSGMPVLVVVLLGGLLVNALWCLGLNAKNGTFGDYGRTTVPLLANFFFAALAGAIWCSQFICQKTGEPRMGPLAYVSLAVLMASAILFSALLGILLGEWKGVSGRTKGLLAAGLLVLVGSFVVTAVASKMKLQEQNSPAAAARLAPPIRLALIKSDY